MTKKQKAQQFVVKPPSRGMGTVPRDGRQVLLWDEDDGAWVLARYQADLLFKTGKSKTNMCWYSGENIYNDNNFVAWQPAPTPPWYDDFSVEPKSADLS